jgi:hypothetical protein
MIGPSNRVLGAHATQIETAPAFTAPGQATWADPSIPHTCGDCAHWVTLKGQGKSMGRCREFSARMRGLHGPPLERRQQACGAFGPAPKPQPPCVSAVQKRGAGGPTTEIRNRKS